MFMGRCDYCLIALETGNICPTCSETVKLKEPPTSETERLLAGSLAIAELAALRRKIQGMHKYFVDRSNEFFDKSSECEGADDGRWSARGTAWYEAANKLKELLETK